MPGGRELHENGIFLALRQIQEKGKMIFHRIVHRNLKENGRWQETCLNEDTQAHEAVLTPHKGIKAALVHREKRIIMQNDLFFYQ